MREPAILKEDGHSFEIVPPVPVKKKKKAPHPKSQRALREMAREEWMREKASVRAKVLGVSLIAAAALTGVVLFLFN